MHIEPSASRISRPLLASLTAVGSLMLSSCTNAPIQNYPDDADERFQPRMVDGRYINPPGSPTFMRTSREELSFLWRLLTAGKDLKFPSVPANHAVPEPKALEQLESLQHTNTLTWLGHASFLIRLDGKVILTDPYLSDYASPIRGAGPKRFVQPGISIPRLPAIDVVLISHNHYDHLDRRTLAKLPNKDRTTIVVPRGVAATVQDLGFKEVRELTWGQTTELSTLRITSTPAIHFSARGIRDRDKTLWSSYILTTQAQDTKIYFAGDTAYHSTVFKQVGDAYGPVDYALVPIGAYEPRNLMGEVHVNPEEAVNIGRDLGAKKLVAMHWGTIVLTTEPAFEPPTRFREAGRNAGYDDPALWVMQIGQTRPTTNVPPVYSVVHGKVPVHERRDAPLRDNSSGGS